MRCAPSIRVLHVPVAPQFALLHNLAHARTDRNKASLLTEDNGISWTERRGRTRSLFSSHRRKVVFPR
jgi:hypothetical protein